jgi:Dullard-like phosphatase family protein
MAGVRERDSLEPSREPAPRVQRKSSRDGSESNPNRKANRWSFSGIEEALELPSARTNSLSALDVDNTRADSSRRRRRDATSTTSSSSTARSRSRTPERFACRQLAFRAPPGVERLAYHSYGLFLGKLETLRLGARSFFRKTVPRFLSACWCLLQLLLLRARFNPTAFVKMEQLLGGSCWIRRPRSRDGSASQPLDAKANDKRASKQVKMGRDAERSRSAQNSTEPQAKGFSSRLAAAGDRFLSYIAAFGLLGISPSSILGGIRKRLVQYHSMFSWEGVVGRASRCAAARGRTTLYWCRDTVLRPGSKPVLLGLASAQVLGAVSCDIAEWVARIVLETFARCFTRVRVDSTTLIDSIQFGGLLPRFARVSCGPFLAYASTPTERKILVLDLDETLVHSSFKERNGCDITVEVEVDDVPTVFFVRKRPHLELFIRVARQWYDLVIFTASLRRYADPLVDALDPTRTLFRARYFREDCVRLPPYNFVKNLNIISPNLGKVIIVDNSPASYALQAANALPIDAWYDDPFDEELLNLLPVLRSLSILEDVRSVLGLRLTRGSLISRYKPLVAM